MSAQDQRNLRHLLDVVKGAKPDLSLPWASSLGNHLSAWRRGRPGSPNRENIANAIDCAAAPLAAAYWWSRMLTVERGEDPSGTHVACHGGPEPLSPLYWGWTAIAQVAAVRLLNRYGYHARQGSDGHRVAGAIHALQCSIDRSAALASLCAAADVIVAPSGGTVYRGPVSLGPGARGKGVHEADNRTIHPVLAAWLGIPPRRQQSGVVAELAEELAGEALRDAALRRQCGALLGVPGSPPLRAALVALLDGPLSGCRLAAPFTFWLWEDGRRVAFMNRNNNGNTGAVFATHLPPGISTSLEVDYLYPYGGAHRVRGKHLIGAGRCEPVREKLWAENMTEEERVAKELRGINAQRFRAAMRIDFPPPDYTVHIGPGLTNGLEP